MVTLAIYNYWERELGKPANAVDPVLIDLAGQDTQTLSVRYCQWYLYRVY